MLIWVWIECGLLLVGTIVSCVLILIEAYKITKIGTDDESE